MKPAFLILLSLLLGSIVFAGHDHRNDRTGRNNGLNPCDPEWSYGIMGIGIGWHSMNAEDIDGDGTREIICAGQISYEWSYWYVLEYDPDEEIYYQGWISEMYNSRINRMIFSDIDEDGMQEIYIGFRDGMVRIYDALTRALSGELRISNNYGIHDIHTGDADNDGKNEIAVADEERIYFIDPEYLTVESSIPYMTNEFSLGNVDQDQDMEIVLSNGRVIEYKGSVATIEWEYEEYSSYDSRMVELSDIDSDGILEIINAKAWYFIDVYDADTQTKKYQVPSDLDIDAILLADVTGDNVDEILYGDGQFGMVHCINSTTHNEMWAIKNPESGVTGIAVADTDKDGSLEVVWGSGYGSSAGDYLYVAGIPSQAIEWASIPIDGPFYALDIADIDNDGVKEIVCISLSSNSGYDSGIITVFDSRTKETEWQCDGSFLFGNWTGIYDVNLTDIDNDGTVEIVVVAGETYEGKIWIINGITKAIESQYVYFSEQIDEFYAQEVDDIDGDGGQEIIAGSSDYLYIINPADFSVEWTSPQLQGSTPTCIMTGNTDNDDALEIICCNGKLTVFDGISHEKWEYLTYDFTSIDLFDFNGDGILEIVAGTGDGSVLAIDGNTHAIIWSEIACGEAIVGIKVSDLDNDLEPEYVFTSEGSVYFYVKSGPWQNTQRYAEVTGKCNSLKISDTDGDGQKEIYAGTSAEVLEISRECYRCLWFYAEAEVHNVSCNGPNDGSIELSLSGGVVPYAVSWNTGSAEPAIYNLSPGNYSYTVTDNTGCVVSGEITILQSELVTEYFATPVSCDQTDDGSATVDITTGTPPYRYLWSTGDTTAALTGLSEGDYQVTVTDAMNCTSSESIHISKEVMELVLFPQDVSCFGLSNGYIDSYASGGTLPYSYAWSNGATSHDLYGLPQGEYSLTVTDANGCSISQSATINEPPGMLTLVSTTPDDPSTPFGEGTATVNVIGGNPPYIIRWNDPFQQTTLTAINLIYGKYTVTVRDDSGCYKSDTATIDSIVGVPELFASRGFKLYPNPSGGRIYLEFSEKGNYELDILIYDFTGVMLYGEHITLKDHAPRMIDLSGFPQGMYCISVILDDKRLNSIVDVIK